MKNFYKIILAEENNWGNEKISLVVKAVHREDQSIIGEAVFAYNKSTSEIRPGNVLVKEDFRRKGIATSMYNFIEEYTGLKLLPSIDQSTDAKLFWDSYSKK